MKSKIENIDDLRSEILRLKLQRFHHEAVIEKDISDIKEKFRIPSLLLHKVNAFFGTHAERTDKIGSDWVTNALRIGLPVALNKMFFGRSGFIIKSLVAMVSQKAATSVNKDTLSSWIDTGLPAGYGAPLSHDAESQGKLTTMAFHPIVKPINTKKTGFINPVFFLIKKGNLLAFFLQKISEASSMPSFRSTLCFQP